MTIGADFLAHRLPSMAVGCPDCHAKPGRNCIRPSGHKAMMLHARRHAAADQVWLELDLPTITHHPDGTFTFDGPDTRPSIREATTEGDTTMKRTTRKTTYPRARKPMDKLKRAATLTKKQRGTSANASTSRATAADKRARTSRPDEVAAFITGKGATATKIGAEFGLLDHSVRAIISGLKKLTDEGGRGLDVQAVKNGDGVTVYSIAKE